MARHRSNEITAVFVLVGLLAYCASTLSANSPSAGDAARNASIATSGTEPRFHGRRLSDVAAELSRHGSVRILVAPELLDAKVETNINPEDWQTAIRSLLKGFDHLAIVDRSGNFRKIWITGRKSFDHSSGTAGGDAGDGVTHQGTKLDSPADGEPDRPTQLPVVIWEPLEDYAKPFEDDRPTPTAPVQMDPAVFESMHVGQPLEIIIPQEQSPLFAVVGETHSQLNGEIQVWSGPIDGAHDTASFTITRGEITTYITVATGTSIYEVSIDNVTGVGQVVNEVELTKGKTDQDFIVPEEASASSDPD